MKTYKINYKFIDQVHNEEIKDYMRVPALNENEAIKNFKLSLNNPDSYIIENIEII